MKLFIQFLITIILGSLFISGCSSPDSKLIGQWKKYTDDSYGEKSIEFFKDHTGVYKESGAQLATKWTILDDRRVKIEMDAYGTKYVLLGITDNNKLMLEQSGKRSKWVRENTSEAQNIAKAVRLAQLYKKAKRLQQKHDPDEAIKVYQYAADEGHIVSQNSLAWIFATSQNKKYWNGKKAVDYALKATSQETTNWEFFDTLAAAYARDGRFEEAIKAQQKSISLCPKASNEGQKVNIPTKLYERLNLYKENQSYSVRNTVKITYTPSPYPYKVYVGERKWKFVVLRKCYYEIPKFGLTKARRTAIFITGKRALSTEVIKLLPYKDQGYYGGILANGCPNNSVVQADDEGNIYIQLNLPQATIKYVKGDSATVVKFEPIH